MTRVSGRLLQWIIVAVGLLAAADAVARVGGGERFGTGMGGSSGGSGGGGGDGLGLILWLLFELVLRYPKIGIPLLILVGVVVFFGWLQQQRDHKRQVSRLRETLRRADTLPEPTGVVPGKWLSERDAGFSEPVLYDWATLVVRRALDAHGTGVWAPLEPFVSEEARGQIAAAVGGSERVSAVVLAGIRLQSARLDGHDQKVELFVLGSRLEHKGGVDQDLYFEERWTLRRADGALSLGPDAAVRLGCPSCGSAIDADAMGACTYCHTPITKGQLQWRVVGVTSVLRRSFQPMKTSRGNGGVEPGADLPTRRAADLGVAWRALRSRHPDFDEAAFGERARGVFLELQAAWSEGKWERARPHVTDTLFGTIRFEVDRYARDHLRNRVEDVDIQKVELVKVAKDAWYEAITVRILASARDWIADEAGNLVGGNDRIPRVFAEYWTFLRAVGTGGAAKDAHHCPSCGAALDRVSQAGICGYCDSRIVSGHFDWVLSRIDQPEVYQG